MCILGEKEYENSAAINKTIISTQATMKKFPFSADNRHYLLIQKIWGGTELCIILSIYKIFQMHRVI